jgi:hypothetical protein
MQSQPQSLLLSDIPATDIDAVARDHKEMGADKIEVIKQANGLFSIKVTYSYEK